MAILPRKEYEALWPRPPRPTRTQARASGARARKEIADGDAVLPLDVVNRIADGENPIRVIREWKDVTQLYLAHRPISDKATSRIWRMVGARAPSLR